MSERLTTANDKYAREVGFDYGHATSLVQAQLLNGFAEGMRGDRGYNADMQISYIAHDLTPGSKALIKRIAEFCDD